MTPPEVYNPQYTRKGYFTMNKKLVTILCVFLIITGVVLFHFTTDAKDTETHAIPYPVNDFSTDTAYPVKEIGNLGNYIRIDMDGTLKDITLMGARARDGDTEEFLKRLLLGEHVYLRFDSSGSKRQVYLFRAPDGLFVNLEMLRQGYGIVWTNPTFDFLELFTQYESIAKVAEKGIWKPETKSIKVKKLWD